MEAWQAQVLVFARLPEAGHCKTRLIPLLGPEGAAQLQAHLLRSTLATVRASGLGPLQLWLAGSTGHPMLAELKAEELEIHWQSGADLGLRMAHALRAALADAPMAVLVGSDAPSLSRGYLRDAVRALQAGNDVVLGAAEDGGYVLVGARTFDAQMFDGIDWGSERVLRQTCARLDQLALSYAVLPPLPDIDTPEDYRRACQQGWLPSGP